MSASTRSDRAAERGSTTPSPVVIAVIVLALLEFMLGMIFLGGCGLAPKTQSGAAAATGGVARPAHVVTVTPDVLDFGTVSPGTTVTHDLVLLNTDPDRQVTLTELSIQNDLAGAFGVFLIPLPRTLFPGQTVPVKLAFRPRAVGDMTAVFQVTDDAEAPFQIPLRGASGSVDGSPTPGEQPQTPPPTSDPSVPTPVTGTGTPAPQPAPGP
ncbi:MAG TPA: hypothetical protein VHF22_12750, partial [Planctomycetota bacterium]|nr:hypothetical protein [Planctomycetota bacterium]